MQKRGFYLAWLTFHCFTLFIVFHCEQQRFLRKKSPKSFDLGL